MKGCRPLGEIEVIKVLEACDTPRTRCLFILGLRTGLRVSELLSLRVRDVMGPAGPLERVYIQKCNTKGSVEGRSIVLHNDAREAIQALVIADNLKPDSFLFQSQKGPNKPITPCQAWRILKALFAKAGVFGNVATHTMRKTFANRMYTASGKNIFATQKLLGHKSLNNTISYVSADQEELDALVKNAK